MIVVIIALLYATNRGGKAVKGAYTSRRDAWDARPENAGAPWFRRRATLAGFLAQMFRHGGPALRDGLVAGWKEGSAIGREKVANWKAPAWLHRERPVDGTPAVETRSPEEAPTLPAKPPEKRKPSPRPATTNPQARARQQADLDLQEADEERLAATKPATTAPQQPQQQPTESAPPSAGADMDKIDIVSPETLKTALEEKLQRQVMELEDAKAAKKRAEEERALTEAIIASMTFHRFPEEDIADVQRLIDPEARAVQAADVRVSGAANAQSAAAAAVEMATGHLELRGRAAGTFYQGA